MPDLSLHFTILLLICAALFAAVALWLAFYRRPQGIAPLVGATHMLLKQGWYQVNLRLINRASYPLGGVSLRCLNPRRARLLPPITSISTKQGDFQTWTDPATEKPVKSIPLDFVLAPRAMDDAMRPLASEANPTAWLFLSGSKAPSDVLLEVTLRDEAGQLYRYEITSSLRDAQS